MSSLNSAPASSDVAASSATSTSANARLRRTEAWDSNPDSQIITTNAASFGSPVRRRASTSGTTSSTTNNNPVTTPSRPKTRWSAAIRAVMQQHHEQENFDGLGLALQQLINQRTEFRYSNSSKTTCREETTSSENDDTTISFDYPPLLSRHNARVMWHYWQQFRKIHGNDPSKALWELVKRLQPTSQTLRASLIFLFLWVIAVAGLGGIVTVYVSQGLWYVMVVLLGFLIDWQDVEGMLPQWLVTCAEQVWDFVDLQLLRGKIYQFREWTASDFLSTRTPLEGNSLCNSLWELPPPTIKQGGKRLALDPNYLQRAEWSEDTVQHVLAIDFCYIMIREQFLVTQAKKRSKNLSRSSSAPVEPGVVVSHTTRQTSMEAIELQVSASSGCEDDDEELNSEDIHDDVSSSHSTDADHPLGPDMSCEVSVNSSGSDVVSELPWLDVGAKIGMRLLNSAHIHRAMASQETTERFMASSKDLLTLDNPSSTMDKSNSLREQSLQEIVLPSLQVAGGSAAPGVMRRKPVHPLWTSPSAAAAQDDANSVWSLTPPSSPPSLSNAASPERPPLSPASSSRRTLVRRHSEEDLLTRPQRKSLTPPRSCGRSTITRRRRIRQPLSPGIRVAVPITPIHPGVVRNNKRINMQYQMGSVVRSERIWVRDLDYSASLTPNCLSVTVKLEKSFLRNGEFADLTFRVMDHWPDRFMPKHSKAPLGSTVATAFGLGVLIGWRVEDDCHIVRSLWRRRGACAYLNPAAIHSVVEAAVGFGVKTRYGAGQVVAYVDGGPRFEEGRFLVNVSSDTVATQVLEVSRKDVYSCHGAQFIPVIEHIREAAHFQMQLDMYRESIREEKEDVPVPIPAANQLETFTSLSEIIWTSFCKAVDEDRDFDQGVNEFMASMIDFLERLDGSDARDSQDDATSVVSNEFAVECVAASSVEEINDEATAQEPGFWFTNDILGGVFGTSTMANSTAHDAQTPNDESPKQPAVLPSPTQIDADARSRHFDRIHAFLRTLLKTVSYARVACVDKTHFRLGLAIAYDVLLFIRTIVKVQQKNVSVQSLRVWKRALEEIWSTIEPIKDRLQRIGQGIAQRMEQQGKRAKAKVIKFVDTILGDERLLIALEQGDWDRFVKQLEAAFVHAKILERENLVYYRKTLHFLYNHVRVTLSNNQGAARRSSEKIAVLAKVVQWIAAPRRSVLKLFERDDILDLFERILVRVFHKEELASRKVMIHALNFHSLRHLRMLKDFSTSGRLWMPVLDAADEEFSWMVSHLSPSTKEIMGPIASLFSLCVAQFHHIADGDLTKDWMDFLLQDEAVEIIHDIDMKLILALESLSRDVKEMMVVLPYYSK